MFNKVIAIVLIFLVILSGGLGYYSYTLSQQINSLNEQLIYFHERQAAQIDVLSDKITTLSGETMTRISNVDSKVVKNLTEIDNLGSKIEGNSVKIDTLGDDVSSTLVKIDSLENEIKDVAVISQSVMDAQKVYQRVSQATVRISNGVRTIGSGFIYDEVHVVTAHHVVDDLSEIYIVLPDGRTSAAEVIGSCPYSDVAVLKPDDELTIEPLKLADSAVVKIGEPVATIGNPMELTETMTTGIVSQSDRYAEIKHDSRTRWVANLIQFDAAVNFGNSGCPLVNAESEVIGMVIARIDPDEGEGIYYAVSSNKVKRVADSLIAQGSFDYPWVGVSIANLTPEMVQERELATTNGISVEGVLADSPAKMAGIKVDDIITAIDGVAIRDVATFTSYLGEYKSPGETATVTLIRDAAKLELAIEIGKRP